MKFLIAIACSFLFAWIQQQSVSYEADSFINKDIDCSFQYLSRFKKHGEIIQTDSGARIYEYTKDSVHYKLLVRNCFLIYSSSEHVNLKSSSWAKFENNCIVFYDSLDNNGQIIKTFVRGLSGLDDKESLPIELLEFYCD